MQNEIWKDIPNYEGLYQVSNIGRIKSLTRYVNHNYGGLRIVKERIRKLNHNSSGYLCVMLNKKGFKVNIAVHILEVIAFLNHNPKGNKIVINHIDFNILNNKLSNLEIVTNRENTNKKHLKSSSKYTGVSWYKKYNKWVSKINYGGKQYHLGYFINEYAAHLAYEKRLKEVLEVE